MFKRFRRTRINPKIRDLVRESRLDIRDFIYPLFVIDGSGVKNEIASMPDVFQMSIDNIILECEELVRLGIYNIILFGIPSHKDSVGSEALSEESIVARCIREIKKRHNDICISVDLCFCEYTDHGHCGILDEKSGTVDNDKTLEMLGRQADRKSVV